MGIVINSRLNPHIKFMYDWRKIDVYCLPFLEMLVNMNKDGTTSNGVYHNPTHKLTDNPLQ